MIMFNVSELPRMVHLYQMGHNVSHLVHVCHIVTTGRSDAVEFLRRKRADCSPAYAGFAIQRTDSGPELTQDTTEKAYCIRASRAEA